MGTRLTTLTATLTTIVALAIFTPTTADAAPVPDPGQNCLADNPGLLELSRPQPGAGVRAVPVVFVHGINNDAEGATWSGPLRESVERIQLRSAVVHTYAFDYHATSLNWITDTSIGPRLAATLACLARDYDLQAIVVAHSMGGLATKYAAAQDVAGATAPNGRPYLTGGKVGEYLAEVITIGTPYDGSWLLRQAQQLLAGQSPTNSRPDVAITEAFLSACTAKRQRLLTGSDSPGASHTGGASACDLLANLFSPVGIPKSPVAQTLPEQASALDLLRAGSPWPRELRVRAIAGDMRVIPNIAGWPIPLTDPLAVSIGDGVVTSSSATAGGVNGPPLLVRCTLNALPDAVSPVLDALFRSPCRHTALLTHRDVIADVNAEVTGAIGSSLAAAAPPVGLFVNTPFTSGLFTPSNFPDRIGINNHTYLFDLIWDYSTPGRATAAGQLSLDDCIPDCATGQQLNYPAKIVATAPKNCTVARPFGSSSGGYAYSKIELTVTSGNPDPQAVSDYQSYLSPQCE